MDAIEHSDAVDVFIGVEVGKGEFHAVALSRAGKRLFDKAMPNDDERLAELTMLCGSDDDLADQTTQTSNRIRGLLAQIHPALEFVLGPRLDHPAVLDLLQRHPSPASLATTNEKSLANKLSKLAPSSKDQPRETAQPGADRSHQAALRRDVHHHARWDTLLPQIPRGCLTKEIAPSQKNLRRFPGRGSNTLRRQQLRTCSSCPRLRYDHTSHIPTAGHGRHYRFRRRHCAGCSLAAPGPHPSSHRY